MQIAEEAIDIQLNLAESIGSPMETIVELERQRVQKTQERASTSKAYYEDLLQRKQRGEAISDNDLDEARNKAMKDGANVVKAQLGAQRSMMEKVFGNMIGSFGENAGIMGPNNLARKLRLTGVASL